MGNIKTERILQILIGVCLAVLVYAIADSFRETVVVAGDSAPDFSITADNGRTITRSNFGGKLLVLNFWATWCPPCIQEMPSLDQFQKNLASSGVVVLGVSVDQNPQAYRNFLGRSKVSFLTARDPEARISSDYGTFKYPETYIIDQRGKVVEKLIGPMAWTDEKMVAQIRSLL
jgi:cytochrome c biogenesis protein CcmG, thiol:disulfide interchange protein DsbE